MLLYSEKTTLTTFLVVDIFTGLLNKQVMTDYGSYHFIFYHELNALFKRNVMQQTIGIFVVKIITLIIRVKVILLERN